MIYKKHIYIYYIISNSTRSYHYPNLSHICPKFVHTLSRSFILKDFKGCPLSMSLLKDYPSLASRAETAVSRWAIQKCKPLTAHHAESMCLRDFKHVDAFLCLLMPFVAFCVFILTHHDTLENKKLSNTTSKDKIIACENWNPVLSATKRPWLLYLLHFVSGDLGSRPSRQHSQQSSCNCAPSGRSEKAIHDRLRILYNDLNWFECDPASALPLLLYHWFNSPGPAES